MEKCGSCFIYFLISGISGGLENRRQTWFCDVLSLGQISLHEVVPGSHSEILSFLLKLKMRLKYSLCIYESVVEISMATS
jgi:hypothetical protein